MSPRSSPAPRSCVTAPFGESWSAWLALGIGVLAVSAHSAASIVFSIAMKPLLAEFGWVRSDFAGALSLRMLPMILAFACAGYFTDRLGPRWVLVTGAVIVGVGMLAFATIDSRPGLYIVMFAMGPGQAAIGSVAASALVLRRFTRHRSFAIGLLNGGDNLINSQVSIGVVALLATSGWRGTICVVGGIYLALGALIMWGLRGQEAAAVPVDTAPHDNTPSARLRDIPWHDWRLWTVCGTYACIYAFITSLQLHFHPFQTDIGRSPTEASYILSTLILIGALGAPFCGWLAGRISARTVLVLLIAGLAIAAGCLWNIHTPQAFIPWAIFYGIMNGGVVALLALVLNEIFGSTQIGRLMGVSMMFCMGATMLGNLFSAAVFDALGSYIPVWQSYTVLMLLALIPAETLRRYAHTH